MADVYEKDLETKSSLTTDDYIRIVGSDNVSYKQLVSDVAAKIVEDYADSTLAGTAQSIKSAIDTLNGKLTITSPTAPTLTQTGGASTAAITNYKAYGKLRFMTVRLDITGTVSVGGNAFTGNINQSLACASSSISYSGSTGFIMSIAVSGAITVRVIGAGTASGAQPYINITYCLA